MFLTGARVSAAGGVVAARATLPTVPDDAGGVDGVQHSEGSSDAWSLRSISSCNRDEERPEKLQATATFGRGWICQFAARFGRRRA
jgi:hypothetical protein